MHTHYSPAHQAGSQRDARTALTIVDDPFAHGGEAGAILRRIDWGRKPIGPVSRWPQSLRTALSICLASRHPICIIWGRDRLYLYNDAYAPIVGAKHPWALGESYINVWPEIWESTIRPILESVERTGEASWCDNLLLVLQRRGFLEECYFSFSFAPTRVEDGSVGGVFTAITETTPQVVGERRLRTLRDLGVQTAIAQSPEEACQRAARVLGANPHDVPLALLYLTAEDHDSVRLVEDVGLGACAGRFPATAAFDDASGAGWPFAAALASGEPVLVTDVTARFGPLPGGPWPEATHTAVIVPIARAGQSGPYGFIVFGVSPRQRFDDDTRSFLTLAAGQVATAIANAEAYAEERRRAEALAEIDRAKTAFFSNVSHEFRTPLTLMLGPLEELLQRPDFAPADRAQLEVTRRNSLRLLKLVNSLLDFSRIEAGRMQASYEPVDLGAYTSELASTFRSAVEKAGLEYVVDCPSPAGACHVDRDLWEKIVFNLLSNALKFTAAGRIEVRLTGDAEAVRLTVRDTGTGIPAAEMPHLFRRFHRIENPRSRTHEGSGIGLALSQELAKLHGGRITAESSEGVGSVFTVTIPTGCGHLPPERIAAAASPVRGSRSAEAFVEEALHWAGVDEEASRLARQLLPASTAPRRVDSPPPARRPRLVIADDNADMRAYFERLLAATYEVELVADGDAALAAIARRRPDLVVSDVMMPRRDGLGLLQALRDQPATRTLPVILVSARAGLEASVEGYGAGADDYLIKPFSAVELRARVATHLRLAEARREAMRLVELERGRLHDLLLHAPACICVLRGPRHLFELVNPPYLRLVGRADASALLGRPVAEALPEAAAQGFLGILDRVFATGEAFVGREHPFVLTCGERPEKRFVDFVYQATRDAAGRIDGILVHAMDVTDQVSARQELQCLADRLAAERDALSHSEQQLEGTVQERTARLSEALTQMEEFSYSISHDLRSPVRAMSAYSEALLSDYGDRLDDVGRDWLARIHRNGARMDRLISDLLTYSCTSRRELQAGVVDLDQLVAETVLQYEEMHADRATIIVESPLGAVRAHEPSLTQAISNLLTNAVKFVPAGRRAEVRLTAERRGECVRVWVIDNGVGIPPEQQHRLFRMFERLHAGLGYEGTGMGLAIVRKAAERMNGAYGVESDGTSGSRFWIELPAVD